MDEERDILDWLYDHKINEFFINRQKFDEALDEWIKIVGQFYRTYNYVYLLKAFRAFLYTCGVTTEGERVWNILKHRLFTYLNNERQSVSVNDDEITQIPLSTIMIMARVLASELNTEIEELKKQIAN